LKVLAQRVWHASENLNSTLANPEAGYFVLTVAASALQPVDCGSVLLQPDPLHNAYAVPANGKLDTIAITIASDAIRTILTFCVFSPFE
jgi:hypothetical protein